MALEAVMFQQDPLNFGYNEGGSLNYGYGYGIDQEEIKCYPEIRDNNSDFINVDCDFYTSTMLDNVKHWETNNTALSQENCSTAQGFSSRRVLIPTVETALPAAVRGKRKSRRTTSTKNKEEVENQRMTHMAVERNRRKQMNQYFAVLRSMMPYSYVPRGDQASIIGGTINFVKELEQILQSLEANRKTKKQTNSEFFSNVFTFPQYSMYSPNQYKNSTTTADKSVTEKHSAVATVEVTMVESHANIKILSKSSSKQLLKVVIGLQSLRLELLHLTVTTSDDMVLYCFCVKIEDCCQLTSANEISAAVYEIMGRIQGGLVECRLAD